MNEETQTITDDASDNYEAVAYLEKDKAERFSEFLKYSGIMDVNIVAMKFFSKRIRNKEMR